MSAPKSPPVSAARARFRQYLRRFSLAISLLLGTILTGIVGFMVISDYSLMEAFYMTIITLASVGYGEVKPLDFYGQLFASFLIVFNMGIFAYAISVLSSFLIEGELRLFLKHRIVYKRIEQLENHTIVCGYGRHGAEIATQLRQKQSPFVVIEPQADQVKRLRESGLLFLEGDATQDAILVEAGIMRARSIIITFGDDAFNVYTVLTARQLNPKIHIITRASCHSTEQKLLRAGADHVVMSELIGGFYMATLVHQPHAVEFFNLLSRMGEAAVMVREVDYEDLQPHCRDRSLSALNIRKLTGANVIGVRTPEGRYLVNPDPNTTTIAPNGKIILLGDAAQIQKFERWGVKRPI